MAYDEPTAERVRALLRDRTGFSERRMFGGICFMLGGHMVAGVLRERLILRVGSDHQAAALARPHTRPFDFTGKPSPGMIYVDPPGIGTVGDLAGWLTPVADRVAALPPKTKPAAKGRRRKP